ncbi:MAG: hypothetical protein V2B15_08790 [Bacteroidota bacterium]
MNLKSMSLQAYYGELMNAATGFREEICQVLDISRRTFYERIKDGSWTDPEKRLLSLHLGRPVNVLFPETVDSHV